MTAKLRNRCEMQKVNFVVYRGLKRNTECHVQGTLLTPEIAEIGCIECGGTGWWGVGPTPAECGPCVECKGTGKILVSC